MIPPRKPDSLLVQFLLTAPFLVATLSVRCQSIPPGETLVAAPIDPRATPSPDPV